MRPYIKARTEQILQRLMHVKYHIDELSQVEPDGANAKILGECAQDLTELAHRISEIRH